MTKTCQKCGTEVPDDAKFCGNCGHNFDDAPVTSNNFNIGKIFPLIIVAIVIIAAILIITGFTGNGQSDSAEDAEHVVLTISDVGGWYSTSGKQSYTLYTEALFTSVPSDMKEYVIKTTYMDKNDTEIGHETEKLKNVYYDTDYSISFGHYTSYTKPHPDYVKVEIIKDGKVVDTYTDQIDTKKISYLN